MTTTAPPRHKPSAGLGVGWALSMVAADRRGIGRILVMALGIGLCALVLLALASISPAIDRSGTRYDAASPNFVEPGATEFRFDTVGFNSDAGRINGLQLDAGVASPPAPPGTAAFPGAGELLVSPALSAALASSAGPAIRALLPGTVVGTIDPSTLPGPNDLFFYTGVDFTGDQGQPATGWGWPGGSHPLDLRIWFMLVTGTTIVAVPLLLFVALAARLGGARRDRRASVLRLLGATHGQVLLVSAVEAVLASFIGLLVTTVSYLWLRGYALTIRIDGRGLQTGDIAPTWAGALAVAVGVPLLAITATVLGGIRATRRTMAVADSAVRPVRAWWRLSLVGLAVILGYWAVWRYDHGSSYAMDIRDTALLCAVVATTMFAVAALTGLLSDRLARLSGRGPVTWLLACRRLAQDGSVLTRPAAALCTVLAGTIALTGILTTTLYADQVRDRAVVQYYGYAPLDGAAEWQRLDDSLSSAAGTQSPTIVADLAYSDKENGPTTVVGTCGYVRTLAPESPCSDGDTFQLARYADGPSLPAGPYRLQSVGTGSTTTWVPPADLQVIDASRVDRADSYGYVPDFVFTPKAAGEQFPGSLDARVGSNATVTFVVADGQLGPVQQATTWLGDRATGLYRLSSAGELNSSAVPWISAALIACGIVTLLISALGQWLTTAQQITDRRRPFALARASGVPVGTLMRSFVAAALVPVLAGGAVAVAAGLTLVHLLRYLRGDPPSPLPWSGIAVTVAIGLITTVVIALGSAWRLRATTGPRALRTE